MSRTAQAAAYLRKKRPEAFPGALGEEASVADINSIGPLEGPEYQAELPQPYAHEASVLEQPEDAGPRPGTVPAQVAQSIAAVAPSTVPSVPQNVEDDDIANAREADRASRLTAGMELAARQLVGGITRTPVGQSIGAAPSEVPGAMARAKSRQERAAEAIRAKRQAMLDDRDLTERQATRSDKAAAILRAEREKNAKAALHEKERAEDLGDRREGYAASRAIAESNNNIAKSSLGLRVQGEKRDAEKFEADKAEKAGKLVEDVPPGYEIAPEARPSGEARKKFAALVGSSEKMKGLTAQMRSAMKGTSGVSRTLDPKVVTGLQQLATQIQIEAKNVAGLGALSGPDMGLMNRLAADPTSVITNLTVDLPKMLDQLDAWGSTQVAGESKATGIRKKAGDAVKLKRTSDGVTKSVSKATADALLAGGGYEVVP